MITYLTAKQNVDRILGLEQIGQPDCRSTFAKRS